MKTKLLRRLRKDYKICHIPESARWRERWQVDQPHHSMKSCVKSDIFYTYTEALDFFLKLTHNAMCLYVDQKRSKTIMP